MDAFVDRRSKEPTLFDDEKAIEAAIEIKEGLIEYRLPGLTIPKLEIIHPTILQNYHLELWVEKSTQDDLLEPLCKRYGIDFQPGIASSA